MKKTKEREREKGKVGCHKREVFFTKMDGGDEVLR